MPDPHQSRDLTDLPIQPTGSGVADIEIAMMQAAVVPDDDEADASVGDETAGYDQAMIEGDHIPTGTSGDLGA